jgi:hypothetical protein
MPYTHDIRRAAPVRHLRTAGCLFLVVVLTAGPALAQQHSGRPLREAASAAAVQAAAATSPPSARRPLFLTGVILGLAGGTAIVLGGTVAKTEDSTSGNTPDNGFQSCESLKSNPVYQGNQCEVLKGPNTALVIGGAIAAAAGVTLALIGAPHSSVTLTPGGVRVRHRLTF